MMIFKMTMILRTKAPIVLSNIKKTRLLANKASLITRRSIVSMGRSV